MMSLKAVAALGAAALLALGLWRLYHAGYEAGRAGVQAQWDADTIRRDAAQRDALLAYAGRLNQAEARHDQDQALIDHLADDARRLRIHLPACGQAGAGPGADGSAGLFPGRVDESFARLQARAGRLFARCDQLNIDAMRANAAATP